MKVLFIYPPRENYIFGVTPHVHVEADAGNYLPIGMLYIAAYLQKHTDAEVEVLDAYTQGYSHQDVKKCVEKNRPDIVGIYFTTYYLKDGIITAENVKSVSSDILVAAGGPHTTLYPRETIDISQVDYVLIGEAEESFFRLVKLLEEKKAQEIDLIDSVLTKTSNPSKDACRARVQNIDELPFPARQLVDYKKYTSILTKKNPATTIITSRGCPFKCYFCSNIESGQKVRYRSASNVADEIAAVIEKYGIRDFLIFDELFTSNKQRTLDICDEILRRKLKIRWHCRSRVDVLDEEMIKKMKKAGCRLIQFGIETGNQRLQEVINKKLDLEKVKKTVAMVYDNGIYTYADFIFGLPTETDEETKTTLEFAKALKLDYVAFGMFHPIPGSVFYEQGLKENRFEDFWRAYVKDRSKTIYDHSWTGKDREKYHNIMARAYREFYLRPGYILKKIKRFDSLSQMIWQAKSAVKVFTNLLLKRFN